MIMRMEHEHYLWAATWFEQQVSPVNPNAFSKESYMYFDGGKPIACISMYVSQPNLFLNWLVANPEAGQIVKVKAFEELIAFCEQEAKIRGCIYSFCFATKPVIEKIFVSNNYLVTARGCTELMKVIGV